MTLPTRSPPQAPFIAPDESFPVYCAFDYEDSFGNIDLYVSFKMADGTWSTGHNLGDQINTPAGEKFPAVSPDGKYLFYVGDQYPSRSYVFGEATYAELMEQNLGAGNGLGGDVYWVSPEVIRKLGPVR